MAHKRINNCVNRAIHKVVTSDRRKFTTHLNSDRKRIMPVDDFKVSHNPAGIIKKKRSAIT